MKKIFALILTVLTLLALVSCGNGVPDGMTPASGENDPFLFYVPKSWSPNQSGGIASAIFSSSDRSNVSVTAVMMEENFSTLDDYIAAFPEKLKSVLPDIEITTGITDTTLGGIEARQFDYSGTIDGTNYMYRQVVCARSGYFYVFTYTSTAENFESHLTDTEYMLKEFSFK